MKPTGGITYSLHENGKDSTGYYATIATYGEALLSELEDNFALLTDRLTGFLESNKECRVSSREIYLFEALMLGTFWNIYGGFAAGSARHAVGLMKLAASARKSGGIRRRLADVIRGGLAFRLLGMKSNDGQFLFPHTAGLEKLINWMKATGEFEREAERFRVWLGFFRQENDAFTFVYLSKIKNFAAKFSSESEKHLGEYTRNVNLYIAGTSARRYFREDKISVCRRRAEYHLNMVGAYIYNQALRSEFINSSRKIVLLPACMKASLTGNCKAAKGSFGEVCTGCTKDCQINIIHQSGRKSDFSVEIVKHSSDISLTKQVIPSGCGIVGVACVPTVLAGGLELINNSVPAQCVLLDHSGCRHWCDQSTPTTLNLSELLNKVSDNAEIPVMEALNNNPDQENKAA